MTRIKLCFDTSYYYNNSAYQRTYQFTHSPRARPTEPNQQPNPHSRLSIRRMAELSTSAIIVIVIIACLALVSLGAALTRHLYPAEHEAQYQTSRDQDLYMRTVRRRTLNNFHRASIHARDLESQCTFPFTFAFGQDGWTGWNDGPRRWLSELIGIDTSVDPSYYMSSEMTPGFSTSHLSTSRT